MSEMAYGTIIKLTKDILDSDENETYASEGELCTVLNYYDDAPIVKPHDRDITFLVMPDEFILHTDLEVKL